MFSSELFVPTMKLASVILKVMHTINYFQNEIVDHALYNYGKEDNQIFSSAQAINASMKAMKVSL